jgi:tetratricopeptide (TPR) repeat protein
MWARRILKLYTPLTLGIVLGAGATLWSFEVTGPILTISLVTLLIVLDRGVKRVVQATLSDVQYRQNNRARLSIADRILTARRWLRQKRTIKAHATVAPLVQGSEADSEAAETLRVIQFEHLLRTGRSLEYSPRDDELGEIERLLMVHDYRSHRPEALHRAVRNLSPSELHGILKRRQNLLDDLVDAACDPLHFAHMQAEHYFQRITNVMFILKPASQIRTWWKKNRTRFDPAQSFTELAIVLFQKGEFSCGMELLRRIESEFLPDEQQIALLRLGRLMEFALEVEETGVTHSLFEQNFAEVVFCLTEPIQLLRFDTPYIPHTDATLSRIEYQLRERRRVIQEMRALWKQEPVRLNQPILGALEMLIGRTFSNTHSRYHFELWWRKYRRSFDKGLLLTLSGLRALWNEDLDTAHTHFRNATRQDRRLRTPIYNLAQVHIAAGRPDKAERLARKLVQMERGQPEPFIMLGLIYRTMKEYPNAIYHFRRAERLGAHGFDIHFQLGLTYGEMGDADKCIHHLSRAARGLPHRHMFYEDMALHFEELGHYHVAQALHELRQQQDWDPDLEWNGDDDGGGVL